MGGGRATQEAIVEAPGSSPPDAGLSPLVAHADVRSCVVISLPHTGLDWPPDLGPAPRVSLPRHADFAVDLLYEGVDATTIRARWSRLVVDLNRAPDDVSRGTVPDHPAPMPRARPGDPVGVPDAPDRHRGVVWTHAFGEIPLVALPLSESMFRTRIDRYHRPYWDAVEAALQRAHQRHGRACLIDAHSMPSVAGADIVLGTLDGTSCRRDVLDCAVDVFRDLAGLRVTVDHPYRGGAILQRFGRPERGHDALQVEVNRALYMDEVTLRPWLHQCNDQSHQSAKAGAQRRMLEVHHALLRLSRELHLLCSSGS